MQVRSAKRSKAWAKATRSQTAIDDIDNDGREEKSYVDCSTCITAALHIRGDGDPHPDHGRARDSSHSHRHFPDDQTFPS